MLFEFDARERRKVMLNVVRRTRTQERKVFWSQMDLSENMQIVESSSVRA